jgi:HPt (histidine-containing phosphotransfer) domain-containing protein
MTRQGDRPALVAVNLDELLLRVENDRAFLRELLGIFKEEFPRLMQTLQHAVARGDMKIVVAASHALKGMLLGLSVTRAAAIASQLEQMGREGETLELANSLMLLEAEVAGLFPELDGYTIETEQ